MTDTATTEAPKRKPGRPRGTPRTGGRKAGTPNRVNQISRDYIVKNGSPIAFLCSVVQGKKFTSAKEPGSGERIVSYPSLDQRLHAARILAGKVMPDQKAVEHSGVAGEPLSVRINLGA